MRRAPSMAFEPAEDSSEVTEVSFTVSASVGRRFARRTRLNILEVTLLILLCSFLAGFLGSLTGLGGGVVIAPLPGLALGVDVRYAIGASLRFRHRHFLQRRDGL